MKSKKKFMSIGILALFIIGIFIVYTIYSLILNPNVKEETTLFIYPNEKFESVSEKLDKILINPSNFKMWAEYKNYPQNIKSGKYILTPEMNNRMLLNKLKAGNQDQNKVIVKTFATLEMGLGKVAQQLAVDSASLVNSFYDEDFLTKTKLNKATIKHLLHANTYHIYWNTSADKFRDFIYNSYLKFWNSEQKKKAEKLKMSPSEITILSSIVMRETIKEDEQPIVAGLYLNRLKGGTKLQADPTVIYAKKLKIGFDTIINRVVFEDLKIQSPYNTYQNLGLPPSAICIVTPKAIDAVLNHEKHDYIFMCADPERFGYHSFTKSYAQHKQNARKYQVWLKEYLRKKKEGTLE